MNNTFNNKVVLVTGGTGSFGNAVVDRLIGLNPKKIIIFSRDEKKQFDMKNKYNNPLLNFLIGDVRDRDSVSRAMKNNVDYVFHAAALKQVPTCEYFPIEAVKTNVLGAYNVIEEAKNNGIKRLVILSTDKAVYPINAMGMSKAMMEKVMISESFRLIDNNNSQTVLCGVRYGNVLYSRGSVIPYFVDLIKKKLPLTVTDYGMTRFLLPLPHAVDLVLHALENGKNGHMYVKKAPACTMETLAKVMCDIFDYDKSYKEVGVRGGEKMHETLVSQEEMLRSRDQSNYFEIVPEYQSLSKDDYFLRGNDGLNNQISYTSENTERLDFEKTKNLLLQLPEIQKELNDIKR